MSHPFDEDSVRRIRAAVMRVQEADLGRHVVLLGAERAELASRSAVVTSLRKALRRELAHVVHTTKPIRGAVHVLHTPKGEPQLDAVVVWTPRGLR